MTQTFNGERQGGTSEILGSALGFLHGPEFFFFLTISSQLKCRFTWKRDFGRILWQRSQVHCPKSAGLLDSERDAGRQQRLHDLPAE